jgi:hypothetical protein
MAPSAPLSLLSKSDILVIGLAVVACSCRVDGNMFLLVLIMSMIMEQRLDEGRNAVAPFIMEVGHNAQQSAIIIAITILFPKNRWASLVERPPLIRFTSIVILCRGIPALSVAILRECTKVMSNLCGTVFDSRGIQQQRGLVVNQKLFCFQLLKTRFLCSKRTSVGCIYFSAGTTMLCAEAQSFVR